MSEPLTNHTVVAAAPARQRLSEPSPAWRASRSSSSAPGPNDLGSGTLPGIPCPKDLSCDLAWIRPSDRFELLQPTCEAIGQVQITELIRRDPVRTVQSTSLAARGTP